MFGDFCEGKLFPEFFQNFTFGSGVVECALKFAGAGACLFERCDAVAQLSGFFVITRFGTGLHFSFEFGEPFPGLTFQKGTCRLDAVEVIFGADFIGMFVEFSSRVIV